MKSNEKYFRLNRSVTGWTGNRGVRVNWHISGFQPWTCFALHMGVRRSKQWQIWPVKLIWRHTYKAIRVGFGLVEFELLLNH